MPDQPAPWPVQREPQIGDFIGHYRLVELLAIGGMGVVYKAHEATLNRHVAIKVLSPKLAADQEFIQRFLHEARAVANLNHPNIIHIYYIGQHGELLYFAMELVEGYDLDALLRQHKQFNVREAVGFVYQAAIALQHAHKHHLLHRDIKPSNLMVTADGLVKVTDFGLARDVKSARSHGEPLSLLGTPDYFSPDEIRGDHVDHRSDIYSLGATLYHLLAGRPPFIGETPDEILQHHLHTNTPPITQFNNKVPHTLQRILERMLAKQPNSRYLSYDALIQDLEKYLKDRPLSIAGLSRAEPAPSAPAAPAAAATAATALPKKPKPWVPVVVAVIVLTVISAGVWLGYKLFSGSGSNNEPLVSPEVQEHAHDLYKALKPRSEPKLRSGFYGDAWAVYTNWPAEFSATEAQRDVDIERNRISDAARLMWTKTQAKAKKLREEEEYDAALDVVLLIQQTCAGIPNLADAIESERQLTLKEMRDAAKRVGSGKRVNPPPLEEPPPPPKKVRSADP